MEGSRVLSPGPPKLNLPKLRGGKCHITSLFLSPYVLPLCFVIIGMAVFFNIFFPANWAQFHKCLYFIFYLFLFWWNLVFLSSVVFFSVYFLWLVHFFFLINWAWFVFFFGWFTYLIGMIFVLINFVWLAFFFLVDYLLFFLLGIIFR